VEPTPAEDLRLEDIGPLVSRVGKVLEDELPKQKSGDPGSEHEGSDDEALSLSSHGQ
jgi:hypothetical protein